MAGPSRGSASRTLSWYSQLPQETQSNHQNALGDVFYNNLNSSSASQRRSKSTPALSPGLLSSGTRDPKREHPFARHNSNPSPGHSDASQSRLQTEKSFEIEQVTDIREIDPEWDDEDIDEIIVISPKKRRVKALSIIPEDPEASKKYEQVDATCFRTLHLISASQNCKIFSCKKHDSPKVLTMKVVTKIRHDLSELSVRLMANEQSMLKYVAQLGLSLVERLQYSFQDNNALYLATDSYTSTLADRLPLKQDELRFYAAEIVEAISGLHAMGITHRNVRPETILLHVDGHLVLGGFEHASVGQAKHEDTADNHIAFLGERIRYCSPEIILGWRHERSVDIWSIGLIIFMMAVGKHPFVDEADVHPSVIQSKILHNSIRTETVDMDDDVFDLVQQCLERNPAVRPSIEDIKVHPYFSDIDWTAVRACSISGPVIPSREEFTMDAVHEDLLSATRDTRISNSHVDGFSFIMESTEPVNPSQTQELSKQRPESLSRANSHEVSITSLPSSFSCTSFGEIKEHRTYATFDNTQEQSMPTDDLSRRNTVSYFPNSLVSMSTPERTPTRGLRKYASLDFELDTIVSLTQDNSEDEDGEETRPPIGSRSTPLSYLPRWSSPLKGFRFSRPLASSSPLANSPYQNLTPDITEDVDIIAGTNKLRKKLRTPRSNSTPLLLPSSYAEPLKDLPAGLKQIGSGIGFTLSRSPKVKNRNSEDGSTTPRRSLSLLPNGSRYQALLSDGFTALPRRLLRAKKRSQTLEKATEGTELGIPNENEDDDEMEAVMKEMYGSTYSLNLGDSPAPSSIRPTAGPSSGRTAGLGFGLRSSTSPAKTKFPSFVSSTVKKNSKPLMSRSMEDVMGASSTLRLVPTRVEDRAEF